MFTLAHPTGNANVRQALQAINEAGKLQQFFTTLAWPQSIPPPFARKTLLRRSYPIPFSKIHCQAWPELGRLIGLKTPFTSIDAVYTSLDKQASRLLPFLQKEGLKALYAYEDGAIASFLEAKKLGIKTLYELPIGHHAAAQKIFSQEAILEPQWAPTLSGLGDSAAKLANKAQELALADHIIVASSFTASTLKGLTAPNQPVSIISYGTTVGLPFPMRSERGPLKVLFVGSLGQRKGLSYLLQAIEPLAKHVQLTLVGRPVALVEPLQKALSVHTHFDSLPHSDILELMRQHDVFVFPSLFEGFGLVLTEALSCGLPIIATPHTAAPDLITHGQEGFITPIRDAATITTHLEWALAHRAELAKMQQAAYAKAQTIGWSIYRKRLIDTILPYDS